MSGRTKWATRVYDSPQKSERNPNAVQYIVIHHAATLSFDAVIQMEMGGKQVSSTVVIKDENVASMFDEYYRAWSLSSGYWDSVSLSSETCNSGGGESGWPISEASYLSLARVVADWCTRYGIPCNRERVMGHREVYTRYGASYATACPGGIDLDRVVREANAIISGSITPAVEWKAKDMWNGRHPNGAITAFGEVSATGLNGGIWAYYQKAYGPYVQLTKEEYEQEFINIKARKAQLLGNPYTAEDAAKAKAGMDAYFKSIQADIANLNKAIGR